MAHKCDSLKHGYKPKSIIALEDLAKKIRIHATRMIHNAKSSHLGSNLSMAEIMAVLYGKILRISPNFPENPDRDRLILSKGHAAAGCYAVLAECGFFPVEWLNSFYLNGARLSGHVTRSVPGIEVSSGSLGHGLSIAAGMALAGIRDGAFYRVFAVLSDGECDEGSTWEAAMFAAHHQMQNLIAIIDYNKIQALDHTKNVVNLEPFMQKWKAFGWAVKEVDGHNIGQLLFALEKLPIRNRQPSCIIAHTVKGKGVSFMENDVLWHYRNPQGKEYKNALRELGALP